MEAEATSYILYIRKFFPRPFSYLKNGMDFLFLISSFCLHLGCFCYASILVLDEFSLILFADLI